MPKVGRRPLTVGLTGAIGSGKSSALELFARLGAETVSTDALAHELLAKGAAGFGPVLRRFGRGILADGGAIDRAALARIVFRSARERKALERLLHPRIRAEARRRVKTSRKRVAVVDVPLLFEAGLEREYDWTLAVAAPLDVRLRRLAGRGMPRAEALRRMKAQLSQIEKMRRADIVLDNSGSRARLRRGVETIYKAFELISDAKQHKR